MNTSTKIGTVFGLILALTPLRAAAQGAPPDFNAMTRQAITRSLPLIQSAATGMTAKMKCVSCHNQSLPQMTMAIARKRGFTVDEKQAKAQDARVYAAFLQAKPLLAAAPKSKEAEKQLDYLMVDPAMTLGYMIAGMAASQQKPDELTALMAQYVAQKQDASGRWNVLSARPPMEASEFAATALGVYALKTYAAGAEMEAKIAKARTWLLAAAPRNTEDKTFRLFGLRWANADSGAIAKAAEDLLSDQRDDGGWGQLPALASDAYATGEALIALHDAGDISAAASAYQRGRFFLLTSQAQDGSWSVLKRAVTAQTYVEAGYPYKNAQFISLAGACWATMALLYTVDGPPVAAPVKTATAAPAKSGATGRLKREIH